MMQGEQANRFVAQALSEAMAQCKNQAIDEQTLRTGLLTITIANFVHHIGLENTTALFAAIPEQIRSGLFDRYLPQNTGQTAVTPPVTQPPAPNLSAPSTTSAMPSNFIDPATQQNAYKTEPALNQSNASYSAPNQAPSQAVSKRRLPF